MNRLKRCRALLVLCGVFALALSASADTLEMKDRRLIKGKYLGGTQSFVRFQVNGKLEEYPVDQIVALTFTGDAQSSGGDPSTSGVRSSSGERAYGSQRVTIPAGTRILVRMIDTVDSQKNHVGDKFRASLEENLTVGDTIVAPKGADVYGRWQRLRRPAISRGSRS